MASKIHIEDNEVYLFCEVNGKTSQLAALLVEIALRDEVFFDSLKVALKYLELFPPDFKSHTTESKYNTIPDLLKNLGEQ
jgi:hypothetical protein